MTTPNILVVDDEPDIRTLLKEILEDEGYAVEVAENAEAARQARVARRPDLTLLDIWMPDVDGITLLKEWTEEEKLHTPVIMMSGHGTVETAVEATRLGAYDFIEKPLSLGKLLVTVERALEAYKLHRENAGLRHKLQPSKEPIGRSAVMLQLREQVERVALHDTTVLIRGETGSGKGVIARYLHKLSPRRNGPFIEVGVASLLSEEASEALFGSEKEGMVHYGLLEQANGGTLYLNDIADMDIATQARLLGALETRIYHRIGGKDPIPIDVRVIAASHHDLEQEVSEGSFRNDLFYHLNVVPLFVPPLREHSEDITDLIAFYVDYYTSQDNFPYRSFNVAVQNRLRHYPWPGNVRELKNLVQRLLIIGRGNEISIEEVETALGAPAEAIGPVSSQALQALPLREAREAFERDYFRSLLEQHAGSVNQVAQQAGIERTHLYRKLRSLGLDPKQFVNK